MKLKATGLTKQCPRCPNVSGEVFIRLDDRGEGVGFEVHWNRIAPGSGTAAVDTGVTAADLLGLSFGCGYCGHADEVAHVH